MEQQNYGPLASERLIFSNDGRRELLGPSLLSLCSIAAGGAFFILTDAKALWPFALYYALTCAYLCLGYAMLAMSKPFDVQAYIERYRAYYARIKSDSEMPTVDIYLPIAGEPDWVVLPVWQAVQKICYPKSRLNLFVLDDKGELWAEKSADLRGFTYLRRPTNELKKAGNLRHAFNHPASQGEFILILDADFIPAPWILWDMLPSMADPDVAIVQTPQYFRTDRDYHWLERGAAFVQELFYRLIQPARSYWGAPVCVGTNALYRRKALAPMGGTAAIEYSEDMHTGFACLTRGLRTVYLPIITAVGRCPDDLGAFFRQQYRWCMGSFSLLLNRSFWRARLTAPERLCYLNGMFYYIATALAVPMKGVPTIVILGWYPEVIRIWNWVFVLPSLVFSTILLARWSRLSWSTAAPAARSIAQWAHLFAIVDKLRGSLMPWTPTGAKGTTHRRERAFYWCFILHTQLVYGTILGLAWKRAETVELLHLSPVLLFAALGLLVDLRPALESMDRLRGESKQ